MCLPQPVAPSIRLIPHSAFCSHVIPLPLFLVVLSDNNNFDFTTTVSFDSDAIKPLWKLVLPPRLLFVFSLISPAGQNGYNSIEVGVTVSTTEGEGRGTFTLFMLPGALGK